MGYFATSDLRPKGDLTSENRVWEIFSDAQKSRLENSCNSLKTSRVNAPSSTKTASGRTYWPSRDPIEEYGGVNVYSFCYNSPFLWFDFLGREPLKSDPHADIDAAMNELSPFMRALAEMFGVEKSLRNAADKKIEKNDTELDIQEQAEAMGPAVATDVAIILGVRGVITTIGEDEYVDPEDNPYMPDDDDPSEEKEDDCPNKAKGCKPCNPDVGTVEYWVQAPFSRKRGAHSRPGNNTGHVKVWTTRQTPYPGCVCVKNKSYLNKTQQGPIGGTEIFGPPTPPTGGGPEE